MTTTPAADAAASASANRFDAAALPTSLEAPCSHAVVAAAQQHPTNCGVTFSHNCAT